MPKVRFTKENLLERKQLKAGWRILKVKSIDEKPGVADPESTTYPTQFVVQEGEDAGVPINVWFSEKSMGRLSEFLQCFTGGSVDVDKDYEMSSIVGRLVQGYCEYEIKTGFNVIRDFRPHAQAAGQKGA